MPALSSNNLPSEYTALEYIESTGTQYIDTGIGFTDTNDNGIYKFSIDIKFTNINYRSILGYAQNTATYWDTVQGASKYALLPGGTYSITDRHTLEAISTVDGSATNKITNVTNVYINNSLDTTNTSVRTTDCSGGTFKSITNSQYPVYAQIYGIIQYKDGTLVRNMKPVRNSNNVLGMYDTVSNTFFTNAGSGTFISGPEVIKIATTKYVENAFADSVSELNTTMGTIKNVVDNTIIQADRIGKLATGKQTRPTGSCPEGRMCLLITETDGTLRWYPICGGDGSVEPFDSNAFLTSLTNAGKPTFKSTQDSDSKWTYYNGFFKGLSAWRKQYGDGETWTYERPFAHATRCTSPNYTTEPRDASPCYTEIGMYKTLTDGEWAVVYEGDEKATNASTPVDPGVIYGISKCVSINLTGSVSYATKATAAQLADPLFSGIPTNQTDGDDYKQCWCKMTAIGLLGGGTTPDEKASNGGIASVSGTTWVYRDTYVSGTAANCASGCAYNCAYNVRRNASFRSAIISTNN